MALEVDRVLACDDLTRRGNHKAVDSRRACSPGVEDHAVAVQAVLVGKLAAALDPGLSLFLRGQRPAEKSLNLILFVDHEAVVLAVDLTDEDARPVAETQVGEGWLGHQVAHGKPKRHVGALGPEQPQAQTRRGRTRRVACCDRLQHWALLHHALLRHCRMSQDASGVCRPETLFAASAARSSPGSFARTSREPMQQRKGPVNLPPPLQPELQPPMWRLRDIRGAWPLVS